ncbi:MAG: riboflavin synthase [Verrucomicrobiales bacterium]|jgi:riboflavin synthase
MFTGIIEDIGTIETITRSGQGARLEIALPGFASGLNTGESVAVNGCCLSVTTHGNLTAAFDILAQTLRVTNLGNLREGDGVNLERALRADSRISGHFVQGHIDTTAEIIAIEPAGNDHRLEVTLPDGFSRYLAHRGSIAVDGISLTAAEVNDDRHSFTCWVTPHTHSVTTLNSRKPGQFVNLEFDMLAKHLERLTSAPG